MTTQETTSGMVKEIKDILRILEQKNSWYDNPEFFPFFQKFLESIVVNKRLHIEARWPMVIIHIRKIIILIFNDIEHDVYKTRDVLKHLSNCMDALRAQITEWSKTYEPTNRNYNACISLMIDYFRDIKYYMEDAYTETNIDNLELSTIKAAVNDIVSNSSVLYSRVYCKCINSNIHISYCKPVF